MLKHSNRKHYLTSPAFYFLGRLTENEHEITPTSVLFYFENDKYVPLYTTYIIIIFYD